MPLLTINILLSKPQIVQSHKVVKINNSPQVIKNICFKIAMKQTKKRDDPIDFYILFYELDTNMKLPYLVTGPAILSVCPAITNLFAKKERLTVNELLSKVLRDFLGIWIR